MQGRLALDGSPARAPSAVPRKAGCLLQVSLHAQAIQRAVPNHAGLLHSGNVQSACGESRTIEGNIEGRLKRPELHLPHRRLRVIARAHQERSRSAEPSQRWRVMVACEAVRELLMVRRAVQSP